MIWLISLILLRLGLKGPSIPSFPSLSGFHDQRPTPSIAARIDAGISLLHLPYEKIPQQTTETLHNQSSKSAKKRPTPSWSIPMAQDQG